MEIVDLFSGCGGLSLGFQNAGFKILAAFDKWEPAVKVYKDNFDHPIYDTDLGSEEGLDRRVQDPRRRHLQPCALPADQLWRCCRACRSDGTWQVAGTGTGRRRQAG